jgi:hypothetical protein
MKYFIAIAMCTLAYGPVSAQFAKPTPPPKLAVVMEKGKKTGVISSLPQKKSPAGYKKNAVGGYFTDARRKPIKGVRAFIYQPDSSIGASGFTDEAGYYEANSIAPGRYEVRVVYPGTKATVRITNVPIIKDHITEVSLMKMDIPTTDTNIYYSEIEPKVEEKKGAKK